MDEQRRTDEEQPEDLEVSGGDAEQVKGGEPNRSFDLTFKGQRTPAPGDADDLKRGGWDGNHNEMLISI